MYFVQAGRSVFLFEEYYGLQITEDEIGYIVLYIQAAIERKKKHQYRTVMVSNF